MTFGLGGCDQDSTESQVRCPAGVKAFAYRSKLSGMEQILADAGISQRQVTEPKTMTGLITNGSTRSTNVQLRSAI